MSSRSQNRRRARELATEYLYQWDLLRQRSLQPSESFRDYATRQWASPEPPATLAGRPPTPAPDTPAEAEEPPAEVLSYGQALVDGVTAAPLELDDAIEAMSRNWSIDRMITIDRAILRLATFELHHRPDVPPNAAINEAIELAKRYSTIKSHAFVNGILDRIAKALPPRDAGAPNPSSAVPGPDDAGEDGR